MSMSGKEPDRQELYSASGGAMITVLCPSYGRPDAFKTAYRSFFATYRAPHTRFLGIVEHNDPTFERYRGGSEVAILPVSTTCMGEALNRGFQLIASDVYGFVGDDHRFRSFAWDHDVLDANDKVGGGIIYCNDLFQGEKLPSSVFIDHRILRALGWFAFPGAKHLWIDTAWKLLGERLDRLVYLPHTVIEHLHPAAGKGTDDEHYKRVNSPEMRNHDERAYHAWVENSLDSDVERVKKALEV